MNNDKNNQLETTNASKTDGSMIPKHDSPGVIQIEDDRERRDGPGGEDGE